MVVCQQICGEVVGFSAVTSAQNAAVNQYRIQL